MPIYIFECPVCHKSEESVQSVNAAAPACWDCDTIMAKVPQASGMAFKTKAGNLYNFTGAHGRVYKAGGRGKPAVIGRGHGVGGRKGWKPPSIAKPLVKP